MSSSPITLVADDVDLQSLRAAVEGGRMREVRSLEDVHVALRGLVGTRASGSRTLDLVGHSTREQHFLRIGSTAIDACRPSVARIFEAIRDEQLLEQLGVCGVRVLGCRTASRPAGLRSLRRLANLLRVPAFGSSKDLLASHYTTDGFNPKFDHILIEVAATLVSARPAGSRSG